MITYRELADELSHRSGYKLHFDTRGPAVAISGDPTRASMWYIDIRKLMELTPIDGRWTWRAPAPGKPTPKERGALLREIRYALAEVFPFRVGWLGTYTEEEDR